jgi:RNA recognition motif-containing protein
MDNVEDNDRREYGNHDDEDTDSSSSAESETVSSDDDSQNEAPTPTTVDDIEVDRSEMQVQANPYNYDCHVKYISALRSHGLIERVREARENMRARFPLAEDQWLEWARDEARISTTDAEKDKVIQIYQKSLKDYQSISLWLSYCNFLVDMVFSSDILPSHPSLKRVRDTFEQALTSVGLHMTEGAKVWAAFRTFEQRVLSAMMAANMQECERSKQVDRIRSLYRRQLSVPHMSMEQTYKDYEQWEASLSHGVPPEVNQSLQAAYKQALASMLERAPYEEAVAGSINPSNPDYSQEPVWWKYLAFEEEKGDPSRVQCLYERAIKGLYLVKDVWLSYTSYMERTFSRIPESVLDVYERAVRNVYWSGELWAAYIRALERAKQPHDQIEGVFARGYAAGLQCSDDFAALFQAYIDYQKRAIDWSKGIVPDAIIAPLRTVLQQALDFFTQYHPGSPHIIHIEKYWAGLEARLFKSIEYGRKMWNELIKKNIDDYFMWCEYISMEKYLGDADKVRGLYRRAAQAPLPDPQRAWADWLMFEREAGSLEQLQHAEVVCKNREREWRARMEKEAEAVRMAQEEKMKKRKEHDAQRMTKRKDFRKEIRKESKKRYRDDQDLDEPPKRQKSRSTPAYMYSPNKMDTSTVGETPAIPTVHVSNLPFSIKEEDIKELFTKFGEIKEVRVVKDKEGRSKGYAFIDFLNELSSKAALSLDGTLVKERPIHVSMANALPEEGKAHIPKPHSDRHNEALTLFVSNLSFHCTEADLKAVFEGSGGVKEVRMSKDNSGKCRGFAYVEFENLESLNSALCQNQKIIKGRPMNLAISNPPKAKHCTSTSSSTIATTTTTTTTTLKPNVDPISLRKPKLVGMIIPRAVKSVLPSSSSSSSTDGNNSAENPKNEVQPGQPSMSNSDFRKLLQK